MQTIWQTELWQNSLTKTKQSDRFYIFQDIYFEKRSLGLGIYGLFALGISSEAFEKIDTSKLVNQAKETGAIFMQVETIDYKPINKLHKDKWKESYYKKFIPHYSVILDLSKDKEVILKEMKSKGRYNIRLANKKGVEVMRVDKTEKNISDFTTLIAATADRQNFDVNQEAYFKDLLLTLPNSELYFARHEGDLLAASIMITQGKVAYYYYGASSDIKKNLMAPYALQWQMILDAQSLGCEIYDFLGAANPNDPNDPLRGVTNFKTRFNPDLTQVSNSYMIVLKPFSYKILTSIRKIKNSFTK